MQSEGLEPFSALSYKQGSIHGVTAYEEADLNVGVDDADVPSSVVIQDAFNLSKVDIPIDVDVVPHCIRNVERGPDNSLVAAGESEDIWAFFSFD